MDHILLWRGVSLVAVVRGGPGVRMAPRVPAESLRSVVFAGARAGGAPRLSKV